MFVYVSFQCDLCQSGSIEKILTMIKTSIIVIDYLTRWYDRGNATGSFNELWRDKSVEGLDSFFLIRDLPAKTGLVSNLTFGLQRRWFSTLFDDDDSIDCLWSSLSTVGVMIQIDPVKLSREILVIWDSK